jgi:GDP-L-fucose synthase
MKVLICGATGFIGRNIAESFVQDIECEIWGVYNKRPPFELEGLNWVRADLTNENDINNIMAGVDVLIQAAATTSGSNDIVHRPYIHVTDNAVMNSLLLRSAFLHQVDRVIFFSCTVMLQSSNQALAEHHFDPSQEIHPKYFGVGWTKVYIEKMCEFYSRLGNTKFTCIRHSNIYGPHDKFDLEKSHVFGATVTKVMQAEDKIVVWGAGEEARDLLYIDDLVDFVNLALKHQENNFEIFNAGSGQAISVKELVNKIIEASGKRIAVEHDNSRPSIETNMFLDCSKAETLLGWSPKISLSTGIKNTLGWWQDNFGAR